MPDFRRYWVACPRCGSQVHNKLQTPFTPADGVFASEEQAQLFALVNSYRDVSMPTRSYPEK